MNGEQATLRLRGDSRLETTEVIREPVAVADVLGRMLAANPAISAFTGIWPEPDGRPDPKALERDLRRGFVVVRLSLDADGRRASVA